MWRLFRRDSNFPVSGCYIETPPDFDNLNVLGIIACLVLLIFTGAFPLIIQITCYAIVLLIYLFLRSRKKSKEQYLFIDREKLLLISSGKTYRWTEYSSVFFSMEYIDSLNVEHINLNLTKIDGSKHKEVVLHFKDKDVNIEKLKKAVQFYAPGYESEEDGHEKLILSYAQTAVHPSEVIDIFFRFDGRAFWAAICTIILIISCIIWQNYSKHQYLIPSSFLVGIFFNASIKEFCRRRFIKIAGEHGLTEKESQKILKRFAFGMGYEGASSSTQYYWVMVLGIIGAFYINHAILNP
jgi:hypothetical protein